ncbi:MAG: hypothetical protein SV375_15490, partial [Thermodesulfobacteriota bacterium]|nr:hypothetical protein [Thermodesulfobacteriota bacterium]
AGPEMTFTPHYVAYIGFTAVSTGGSKIFVGQGLFGGYPPPCTPAIHISGSDLMEKLERGDKDLPSTVAELVTTRTIKGDYRFMHPMIPPTPAMKGDVLSVGEGGGA